MKKNESPLRYANINLRGRKMLQELILAGEELCASLERAIAAEHKFALDVTIQFERMVWDQMRITNDLKAIKAECGEYV